MKISKTSGPYIINSKEIEHEQNGTMGRAENGSYIPVQLRILVISNTMP